jgi:hydrogenase maturation protease
MYICVAGIGNRWAMDDAVGPEVVQRLQARHNSVSDLHQGDSDSAPVTVTFKTFSQSNVELFDVMSRCDVLILVDAVDGNSAPGTLYCEAWRPDLLASRGVERASSHGLGVREILDLAAALGRLPEQVLLWGIQVVCTEPGTALSPEVAAVLPAVVECLHQELQGVLLPA